jgi:hypothetical protein
MLGNNSIDDKWSFADAIRYNELERREKQFKSYYNSFVYWEVLRDYQLECVEDMNDLVKNWAGKVLPMHTFVNAYRSYISTANKIDSAVFPSLHPVEERLGKMCQKVLLSADDLMLQNMESLKCGIEEQVIELICKQEDYFTRNYRMIWREGSDALYRVAKADMRVRQIYDRLVQLFSYFRRDSNNPTSPPSLGGSRANKDPTRLTNIFDSSATSRIAVENELDLALIVLKSNDAGVEYMYQVWFLLLQYNVAVMRFNHLIIVCQSTLKELFHCSQEIESTRQQILLRATGKQQCVWCNHH